MQQTGLGDTCSRLGISYGAATVRAVLVASGRTTVLHLDGAGEMSTAVHVSGAGILIGAAAWRQAPVDPDGMVLSPLRAATGTVTVAGGEVEVVELVAATLRQVAAVAQRVAGEPIEDVRLVVPAGWGPRRRTWLRHAARAAGLSVSRLVEAPVAALSRPGRYPVVVPDWSAAVLDVGAGCEVTVLRRSPAGLEVLSTLADPDAGGDRIDAALVQAVTGTDLDGLPGRDRWATLASVRAARHALSEQVAVTVPMPGDRPPIVVGATQVAAAAQPVFERVAELARQALGNADLTVEQAGEVHLIGAVAVTPGAADSIAEKLGIAVAAVEDPHLAAVLGAADAGPAVGAADVADPLRVPPWRRLVTLALPGLVSLGLYAHFVLSADFNNGTPVNPLVGYYVLANWGELAVAAVMATITFLQAAALLAPLLGQHSPAGHESTASRVSAGVGLAVAAGLATGALYAITAAVFFNEPISRLMHWALLPTLPTCAAGATLAVLAWRRNATPVNGWDGFLSFPVSAMATATAGIIAVGLWWQGRLPWWLNGWTTSLGLAGGLLLGAAIACTLMRHPAARAALTLPIGLFTTIISRSGPDILAIMWAIAVGCWWAWHAWALIRTPPAGSARR